MATSENSENTENVNNKKLNSVMGLLKNNTQSRNYYENALNSANNIIRESKEGHFATLGRLVKYEGLPIIEEALDYAKQAGLFCECESKYLDVYSAIEEYTTKSGKVKKAHFTRYGKFIKSAKENDKPVNYKGYFLYREFSEKLEKYRNNDITTFRKLNDLFTFVEN
jgi:hypothetical protein